MSSETSIFDESPSKTPAKKREISKFGLAGIGIFGGFAVGIVAVTLPFVSPGFRRVVLPYVPATTVQIENVMQALRCKKAGGGGDLKSIKKLIDLGSGDGRIVIECAKNGIESHGVELNPWLVLFSKYSSWREKVGSLTTFRKKDLFKVNLSDYDRIVIFGVDSLMPLIEEKITSDYAGSGKATNLVVCRFPFPNWQPIATFGVGVDQVWLYDYNDARDMKIAHRSREEILEDLLKKKLAEEDEERRRNREDSDDEDDKDRKATKESRNP